MRQTMASNSPVALTNTNTYIKNSEWILAYIYMLFIDTAFEIKKKNKHQINRNK